MGIDSVSESIDRVVCRASERLPEGEAFIERSHRAFQTLQERSWSACSAPRQNLYSAVAFTGIVLCHL